MLNLRDLTPHTGVEVSNVDCAQNLPPSTVAELLRTLDERGVVLLRGQTLTMAKFMAFARALGPLVAHPYPHLSHGDFPELILNSNVADDGKPGAVPESGRHWQSDGAHQKMPHRLTVQYAVEIPAHGGTPLGDTVFAHTGAAYDALPPDLRQLLPGMHAQHTGGPVHKWRTTPYFADAGMTRIFRGGAVHPVVRTHPVTRRKCLFVAPASAVSVRGMHDRDSRELLAQLHEHLANPAFHYRHVWQVGDVLLWDNCSMQYRVDDNYAPPLRRVLYRAMVKGAPAH
jgi:taurine dioxygenase